MESLEKTINNLINSNTSQIKKQEEELKKINCNIIKTCAESVKNIQTQIYTHISETKKTDPHNLMTTLEEYNNREKRKLNLIIYGLSENGHTPSQLREVCNEIKAPSGIEIVQTTRLGATARTLALKPRLLLNKFKDLIIKRTMITRAKQLRQSNKYNQIYIKPDMIEIEREREREREREQNKRIILRAIQETSIRRTKSHYPPRANHFSC